MRCAGSNDCNGRERITEDAPEVEFNLNDNFAPHSLANRSRISLAYGTISKPHSVEGETVDQRLFSKFGLRPG
jgi:hypothetical protein